MSTTTIARLRTVLDPLFPDVATVLRRLREDGLLPAGRPGKHGVHSATINAEQAALVLLALACGAEPIDAPATARDLGGYRAVAWFWPPVGPCSRRPIDDGATLLAWLAEEIVESAAEPAYRTAGLLLEDQRISTLDPDDILEFQRRKPVLRDVSVARERLEFGPAERVHRERYDSAGRPLPAAMSRVLEPAAIRVAASAFRGQQQRTVLSMAGAADGR